MIRPRYCSILLVNFSQVVNTAKDISGRSKPRPMIFTDQTIHTSPSWDFTSCLIRSRSSFQISPISKNVLIPRAESSSANQRACSMCSVNTSHFLPLPLVTTVSTMSLFRFSSLYRAVFISWKSLISSRVYVKLERTCA